MALLFGPAPAAQKALFLFSPAGADGFSVGEFARLKSGVEKHGMGAAALACLDAGAPTQGLRRNELLSHLSGLDVFHSADANGVLLVRPHDSRSEATDYLHRNYDLFNIHSLGWEVAEGKSTLVERSLSLYKAGVQLAAHLGYSRIVCGDWPAFDAALRIKRESGAKLYLHLSAAESEEAGIQSRIDAALKHADGVVVNSPDLLRELALRGESALGGKAADLRNVLNVLSLESERHLFELIASNQGLPQSDRRAAISFLKQLDRSISQSGASSGRHHVRSRHFALFSSPAAPRASARPSKEELAGARKKVFSTKTVSGAPLGARKIVYACGLDGSSAENLFSALKHAPKEIALLAGGLNGSRLAFSAKAVALGLGDRVAVAESELGAAEMLACHAVVALGGSKSLSHAVEACAIADEDGLKAGPVLLKNEWLLQSMGDKLMAPLSLSPKKPHEVLASLVLDSDTRERLRRALREHQDTWTPAHHAREFAAFLQ